MRILLVIFLMFFASKPVVWTGNEQLIKGYGALMIGVPIVMFIYRLMTGTIGVVVVEPRGRGWWARR
jgi:hypothetical protein